MYYRYSAEITILSSKNILLFYFNTTCKWVCLRPQWKIKPPNIIQRKFAYYEFLFAPVRARRLNLAIICRWIMDW